jgi:osmotically-inducible protein OsmY
MPIGLNRAALIVAVGLALAIMPARAQAPAQAGGWSQEEGQRIAQQVVKQVLSLPEYSVFDDIHFGIKGRTVILYGSASRPTLKSAAEKVVKGIKGVESVDNQIEVLPNSPNDDRIRADVYRAIYSASPLQKYTSNRGPGAFDGNSIARAAGGITNDPPIGYHAIHIIVKNGNVTLKGVVSNSMDASIANIRANQVPGVFSVSNDLVVENEAKKAPKG